MIDFELHNPNSLAEAFNLLETYGEDARVMAGGTALVLQMKQRLAQPEHVISLRRVVGLNQIEESVNGVYQVINGVSAEDAGKFLNFDGTTLPW